MAGLFPGQGLWWFGGKTRLILPIHLGTTLLIHHILSSVHRGPHLPNRAISNLHTFRWPACQNARIQHACVASKSTHSLNLFKAQSLSLSIYLHICIHIVSVCVDSLTKIVNKTIPRTCWATDFTVYTKMRPCQQMLRLGHVEPRHQDHYLHILKNINPTFLINAKL